MKFSNIGYLLKEGFKGIFLHGFMSFAAVCVTVACLIIVGSFSILAYNLDVMVQDLNQTSEILVYVDSDLPDAEARSIGTKINALPNILQATFLAMIRSYEGLNMNIDLALVDGNRVPPLECNVKTVVKGDSVSASIAAASILAKVSRDRYMKEIAEKYPQYQFEKHKGYGTKLHYEMLDKYGASDIHRKSFLVKYYESRNGSDK